MKLNLDNVGDSELLTIIGDETFFTLWKVICSWKTHLRQNARGGLKIFVIQFYHVNS